MLDLSRPRLIAACTVLAGLAVGWVFLAMLVEPALAAGRSVAAKDGAFSPATITIKVGDTITWTNVGVLDHNVTFQGFHSGTLAKGETYKHTFAKAGTFAYRCTIHENTAKVVVAGPPTAQPTKKPTLKPTPKPTPTPAPSPSPTPAPTPSASTSRGPTASPVPTSTPTSVPSAASATPSASVAPPSTAGQPTPVGDTAGPTTALVVAFVVAGIAGVGAFVVRRR